VNRIQSRGLNIALVVAGAILSLLAIATVVEGTWMYGIRGLVEPNTVIWAIVFLALGLWCGLGGWKNLRSPEGGGR
jgi:hypothetical protein